MSYAILRTAKLKTMGNISGSLAHTYRTIDTPNADASRTHLNDNSLPNHAEALQGIQDKLPSKTRKNGVLCIEYLITASPDWKGWGTDKQSQYLADARKWLEEKHGANNVAMVGIQLDETTPHLVAYVLPYDDKGKMNARHWLGGRDKLSKMQTDFHDKVGRRYGLERGQEGSRAKHETVKKYYAEIQQPVKDVVKSLPDVDGLLESAGRYKKRAEQHVSEKFQAVQKAYVKVKKELGEVKEELAWLSKDTEVYRSAKVYLNSEKRQEFDRQVSALGHSLYQQQKNEYQAKLDKQAEQQRQIEQERLRSLGVDAIAGGKGIYYGKVIKVDDKGAYQQTDDGLILHPNFANLQAGKVWSIDYSKRQATPVYDTSHFGKNRNQDCGRDL